MSGSNVTVIGKITDVSGIVLIYSNGGKGEVRVAKVGEEILSTDVIDDTNGNYKIELANRSIRFLQNEDLSVHDVEQNKNINELLQTPKIEQDEKKKAEEKTITEQKQEEKTTDVPEKKYEQDNNDQKQLEELTNKATTISGDSVSDGGGKFLTARTGVKEVTTQFSGVLGADGKAVGTDAIGDIGMSNSEHEKIAGTRSGKVSTFGDIHSSEVSLEPIQYLTKEADRTLPTYAPETRISGEPPPIWVNPITPPQPPGPPEPPEPPIPLMVRELVYGKFGLTANTPITDTQYDLVKDYNYAAEVNLTEAVNCLKIETDTLSITVPSNVTIYLMPYAGYVNNINNYKTDNGDGTATYEIDKSTLIALHNAALIEADNINATLSPLLANRATLQTLQSTANTLSNINLLQTQINDAEEALETQILALAKGLPARNAYIDNYKALVALQSVFEDQSDGLTKRVTDKIAALINDNIANYNQLVAANNAITNAVKNDRLVFYTNTDTDVDYTVEVNGSLPYSATGKVNIDAVADGIQFGNDGKPVGEVTASIDHKLNMGSPADPSLDKVEINLKVNVKFIDPDNSEAHIVTIPLPTALVGMPWSNSNLPVGWSYINGALVRQAISGENSLNDSLMIEFLKSDFKNITAENLVFKIQFVSVETIAGDADTLENNQLNKEVIDTRETLNNTVMVKELGEGHISNWVTPNTQLLMNNREVGYLNVQAELDKLKIKIDFLEEIYSKGTIGYENAVNAVFNTSSIAVTLSSSTAKVLTGVPNSTFDNPSTGVFVLDGPNLRLFYNNWTQDNTKNSLFVGQAIEHNSTDFTVNITGQVKNETFKIMTDQKVIIDAVAENIAEVGPVLGYVESGMRAGPKYIDLPINVTFTAIDTDGSEKFKVTIEIEGIDVDGQVPVEYAAMNFQILGWDKSVLKDLTWELVCDKDPASSTYGKTIITTEIPGSYIQSIGGIFNENLKIRFDTTALTDLRGATDGAGVPAPIDHFPVTVKVQSQEVLPTDGSNKDFDLTDNISNIVSNTVQVINLPINVLFAVEVQNDNDVLTTYESIHLDFKTLIDDSGKTADSIIVRIGNDTLDNMTPDIDIKNVTLIWKETNGTVHEVTGVYDVATYTKSFTINDLAAWNAAGCPDLQLVSPKYIAGTYDLLEARVDYTVLSGGGSSDLYGQTMDVRIGAVASGMQNDGVIVDDLELTKGGAHSINNEALSYISLHVKGTFLDIDNSENHQIIITLPDNIDGHALVQLLSGKNWALLEQHVTTLPGGDTQITYEDKSGSTANLGGGVTARFDADSKSIIIDNIPASFDGTLYFGFNTALLELINNFNPEFTIRAKTQEVRDMLSNDIDADPEPNSRQVYFKVEKMGVTPFTPSIILDELQKDGNKLTIDQVRDLSTLGQIKAINISDFISVLHGDASNASIQVTLSGGGTSGVILIDHAGHIIQPQANGTIVLTAAQIADYITSPTDMNIYILPKQYAHDNFTISVTGYNNSASYAIRTAMPVEVNAVAAGADVVAGSSIKAEIVFSTKSVDLTPYDNDPTKTDVLNNKATLKLTYDINLADVLDKSQTNSLVIDIRSFLKNVPANQLSSVMAQMALDQQGTGWSFEISNKYNLYLAKTFNENKLSNIQGNAVILLDDGTAYFIKDGALVHNQDGTIKSISGVDRAGIHYASSDNPESPVADQSKIDQVITATKASGDGANHILTTNNDYYTGYIICTIADGSTATRFNGVLSILNVDITKIAGDISTLPINASIVSKEKPIVIDSGENPNDNEAITVAGSSNVNLKHVEILENQGVQYKLDLAAVLNSIEHDIGYGIDLVIYLDKFKAEIIAENKTIDQYFTGYSPQIVVTVDSSLNGKLIIIPGTSNTVTVTNGTITLSDANLKAFYKNWDESITGHLDTTPAGNVMISGMLVLKNVADISNSTFNVHAQSTGGTHPVSEDATGMKFGIATDLAAFFSKDLNKTITIAVDGIANGSIVHIPGADDITVVNGKIVINGDTLKALYQTWYNSGELITNSTISIETLSTVLRDTQLNPNIKVTGVDLTPIAGSDAIGTLVRDVTYNFNMNAVLNALSPIDPSTVNLTFTVSSTLNGMTITIPGVAIPITIANGTFTISAANMQNFYNYLTMHSTEQNASFAKLSTNGVILLASELGINSIAATYANGYIDLSGPTIAGHDVIGGWTLQAGTTYKYDLNNILTKIDAAFDKITPSTINLTFTVDASLNGKYVTVPGLINPIQIVGGTFSLSGVNFQNFYNYWKAHTNDPNARIITLAAGIVIPPANALITTSATFSQIGTGIIDLSGPSVDGTLLLAMAFSGSIHSLDITNVLNLMKVDLQDYMSNGGAYATYFTGQVGVTLNLTGLLKNVEIDIPGVGRKVITQGTLTLSGDELKALYSAWDQAHTDVQKLAIANIKISQALYSAENFLTQVNFTNSKNVTTIGEIKFVDVVPVATYQSSAKLTAGIEYVLADANDPTKGFAENAILNININSLSLKDITDGSERYTLTINLNIVTPDGQIKFTIPTGSASQWQAVKDDRNNIIALKIFGTGKELMDLLANPDFNTIKLATNMTKLNSALDSSAITNAINAHVYMQITATDVDGSTVVSNVSSPIAADIDYNPTSHVNEYQGAKYILNINSALKGLFDQVDSDHDGVINTTELDTFFESPALHFKLTFNGIADGTAVLFPELGYLKVDKGIIDLDYRDLKEYFTHWSVLSGDARNSAGILTVDPVINPIAEVNKTFAININAALNGLREQVDANDNGTISESELNTYFNVSDLHLKITFNGVADGTKIFFPGLGYLNINNGVINLNHTQLKNYFSYWENFSGDTKLSMGFLTIGPITDPLAAGKTCSIALEGATSTPLDVTISSANLTQVISSTVVSLTGGNSEELPPSIANVNLMQNINYNFDVKVNVVRGETNPTEIVINLPQVPIGTVLHLGWPAATGSTYVINANKKIIITDADSINDILSGHNNVSFTSMDRIVDLNITTEVTIGGNLTTNIITLQSDMHLIDMSTALIGLDNDLRQYIYNGGNFDAYFANTTTITIKLVGISSGAIINFPILGNKAVSSTGEITLINSELKQLYNAWKLVDSNTNLTYTQKATSLAALTMVPIHASMYATPNFSTQVNYTDSAGVIHNGKQVIVTLAPVVTTDSYATYSAGFVYSLLDIHDPSKGFTNDIILKLKLNSIQLHDTDGSENHTITIELGSNFKDLPFTLSGSSLWHIEWQDADPSVLNDYGKYVLVFGPVTNLTQSLLTNPEFTEINISFNRTDLFNKFDSSSLSGVLENQIIIKIDNQEISTTLQEQVTRDTEDVNYAGHTVIVENQGQFLYFNITDVLNKLATQILATADRDNDLSFPSAEQINNYFKNYFGSGGTAATVLVISGLKDYSGIDPLHKYSVTAPDGTKIELIKVTGGYQFSITADQLQSIMLKYDPTQPERNIFSFNVNDFDPQLLIPTSGVTFSAISSTYIPFEINMAASGNSVLGAIKTAIGASDVDTYFANNYKALIINVPDNAAYPEGSKIYIPGLNKSYTVTDINPDPMIKDLGIQLELVDFKTYYKAWDAASGIAKTHLEQIMVTHQGSDSSLTTANVTVTIDKIVDPDVNFTLIPAKIVVNTNTIDYLSGSAVVPEQSVNLDLTDALRELESQLLKYIAADPLHNMDTFFTGAGAKLNVVLTGIADGTQITIPGVINPVKDSNGLLISAAMSELKDVLVKAGVDPASGAPEYFRDHPTQKVIELNGIADDINISFDGVKDLAGNLIEFSVQNGRIIIGSDYIEKVYQAWLSSDAYTDPSEPMQFIADPEPSGIATKNGIVTLTEGNLEMLYNYWKAGDASHVPPIDPMGSIILNIKPKQHTNNDFITQVTLNVDSVDANNPLYSSAATFVDVKPLASGIDEVASFIKISDRSADVDYGPNIDQIGELGHLKITVHVVYLNDSDDSRVIEILIPKSNAFAFNFNQSINQDWYYDPYGSAAGGILRYIGSTSNKDPATGKITISSEINLTYSTVQLAKYVELSDDDNYNGNKVNIENVFKDAFVLQAQSTEDASTKLQKLLPVEPDLAVYNVGLNKQLEWLDMGSIIHNYGGVGNMVITFNPGTNNANLIPETINIYLQDPLDTSKVIIKTINVVDNVLTISAADIANWRICYEALATKPLEQAAIGKLMIGFDPGNGVVTDKITSVVVNGVDQEGNYTVSDVQQIQFVEPGTTEYILDMNSIFSNMQAQDGGVKGGMTITIAGDVGSPNDPLAEPAKIIGGTVYIPGYNQSVTYTTTDGHATISLTIGQLTAWYNYWNGLSSTEKTNAAKLVMARLDTAVPWLDSDNVVQVTVTGATTSTYDKTMAAILPADQVSIPVYDQADIDNNSIAYMKDASVQYSLSKVFAFIYNVLLKNDGIRDLTTNTKYQGIIDANTLSNILTMGIGGTQASCLDFLFFSKDGVTQTKQKPMVLFFDKELDQEQIGFGANTTYGPLANNKVTADKLSILFGRWFEDQKAYEADPDHVPKPDLMKYCIYIIAEDSKDVDYRFDASLKLKDLTDNSEEVNTILVDEKVPVIVTKDIGVNNQDFDTIISGSNFSVGTQNTNVLGSMHAEKYTNYLHVMESTPGHSKYGLYGYDGPTDDQLLATFSLNVKFQALKQPDNSIPKITKIYIQLPIDSALIQRLDTDIFTTTAGWYTQIINGRVTAVWAASTETGGPVTNIDDVLQFTAKLTLLTKLTLTDDDLLVKVDYDSSLQQDLYLYASTAGNSTGYKTIDGGFADILTQVNDYVRLNATNTTITANGEGAILEAADSGGILSANINQAQDDILIGRGGNDHIYGGKGNDIIFTGSGKDFVDAGEGDDVIYCNLGSIVNWGYTFTPTVKFNPPSTPIYLEESNSPITGNNNPLGNKITYFIDDSSHDIVLKSYELKQTANVVVDEDRTSVQWYLSSLPSLTSPEGIAMFTAIQSKYAGTINSPDYPNLTDAQEAAIANGGIYFVWDDNDSYNAAQAMTNDPWVDMVGSLKTYNEWAYGKNYTPCHYVKTDNDYKVTDFSITENLVSTKTVGYSEIIAGEGADRIYAGSNGSIIDLTEATPKQDIVTYTNKDTTVTTAIFDIIKGFGNEDKLDLTQLFKNTIDPLYAGAPSYNEAARKDMFKVVQAVNLGDDNAVGGTGENSDTESTAVFVQYSDHGSQKQVQIAILEGLSWGTDGAAALQFVKDHSLVVDPPPTNHDYLG